MSDEESTSVEQDNGVKGEEREELKPRVECPVDHKPQPDSSNKVSEELPQKPKRGSRGGARSNSSRGSGIIERLIEQARRGAEDSSRAPKLRQNLSGKIVLQFTDVKNSILFDWTTEEMKIDENYSGDSDCKIRLRSEVLERLLDGKLNSQIGIFSGAIKVTAAAAESSRFAVYFFNLLC